jgi:ATP-dependent Lon protease
LLTAIQGVDSPGGLADLVATFMDATPDEKQEILETVDIGARMERVSRLLAHRIEVLRLSQEIGRETKASLDSRNREVLLREQMAAIQRQLGEADEGKSAEIAELEKAIANAHMPKEVDDQARKELRRLQHARGCGRVAWCAPTSTGWSITVGAEETPIDIAASRRSLMRITSGSRKSNGGLSIPRRRKLSPEASADPVLCQASRVGKTSSVSHCARHEPKFVRVSLGGVHDEAEIRPSADLYRRVARQHHGDP